MTSRELLSLLLRRWYLVLLGAALTVGAAVATTPAGVYWTQFNVVLLPPTYEEFPNELENSPYALTQLAGLVVAEYNGTNPPLLTSSSDTTMYGMGDRNGVMVRMPNHGNQWNPVYSSPNIDVQAAADTPQSVSQQSRQVTVDLQQILKRLQDSEGVATTARVTIIASAADPSIIQITGSRTRALGAIGLVGIAVTISSIYWLERLFVRRKTKRLPLEPLETKEYQPSLQRNWIPAYVDRIDGSKP